MLRHVSNRLILLVATLGVICLTVVLHSHFSYWHTYQSGDLLKWHRETLSGTRDAPWQYRILIDYAAALVSDLSGREIRYAYTLFDAASLVTVAAFLTRQYRRCDERDDDSGIVALSYAGLFAFGSLWLPYYYQLPYTLPSCAYVAASLWLYEVRKGSESGLVRAALVCAIFGLSIVQSFNRAEVVVALGVGLALQGGRRRSAASLATGIACAAAAALIQLWLARVMFPHAPYPYKTGLEMFAFNISRPLSLIIFLLFVSPLFALWSARRHMAINMARDLHILVAGTLQVLFCFVAGKIDEVRIFVPFYFPLIPLVAAAFARSADMDETTHNRHMP